MRRRTGATILAIERGGELTIDPPPELRIASGDGLLTFSDGPAIEALEQALAAPATARAAAR